MNADVGFSKAISNPIRTKRRRRPNSLLSGRTICTSSWRRETLHRIRAGKLLAPPQRKIKPRDRPKDKIVMAAITTLLLPPLAVTERPISREPLVERCTRGPSRSR